MVSVEPSPLCWIPYLALLREDVHVGAGIFAEDDELREIMQECFERGDVLNGVVSWDKHLCPGSQ